jgi:hypothetical protein
MEPPPVRRMPLLSPSGAPTPGPAPEGGEVLSAGRARALAAEGRNQPHALERMAFLMPSRVRFAGLHPPLTASSTLATPPLRIAEDLGWWWWPVVCSTRNDIDP